MAISQNTALFSLLGTMYGGDGRVSFALPDLRGRVPLHRSTTIPEGAKGGLEEVYLTLSQMAAHDHAFRGTTETGDKRPPLENLLATSSTGEPFYASDATVQQLNPASINPVGGGQSHENLQPFLVMSPCIALYGLYPPRS